MIRHDVITEVTAGEAPVQREMEETEIGITSTTTTGNCFYLAGVVKSSIVNVQAGQQRI